MVLFTTLPASARATDWHCHLISLGVSVPEEMKPALDALSDAVYSTALEPRLETIPAPESLVSLFQNFVKLRRHEMKEALQVPLITKMEMGIASRIQKFRLVDPHLLQIMRGPKRESDEVLNSYRDLLRLSESQITYFEGAAPTGIANHQTLFAALNSLAILMNPSGPFGVAKEGSFAEALATENKEEDYGFFEFRRIVRVVSFEQASIYALLKSRGELGPYVPRIGALIPVDRNLTPYEDNLTIGLPVEYVSFAPPHGNLYRKFRASLDRFLGSAHAFTSVMYANKSYGMTDILGNYARTMKQYQAARDGLPPDYQVILDLVFATVRFETNQNIALGPIGIRSLLKRFGTEGESLELNAFSKRSMEAHKDSGALDRFGEHGLDTEELVAMKDQLLKYF